MKNYRMLMWGAIVLTAACWGLATGLAVEKIAHDGINSWTLLLAMPVLTLAVGWLIHQAVDDLCNGGLVRSVIAAVLAVVALGVTLPTSIGSAGSAKDTAIAEANASNRGLAIVSGDLAKAKADLVDADAGVLRECLGAPAVIPEGTWPKCQWWRRQVAAHTLSVEKYGKAVTAAPAEKQPLSGETRIAWAAQKFGYAVTEQDVQMAQPMAAPLAFELLCAFFLYMALEFHRLASLAKTGNSTATTGSTVTEQAVTTAKPAIGDCQADFHCQGELPSPAMFSGEQPEPPPSRRRKPSKRAKKRDDVIAKIRAHTLRHGSPPSFTVVRSRHRLSNGSAHRYLKQALS